MADVKGQVDWQALARTGTNLAIDSSRDSVELWLRTTFEPLVKAAEWALNNIQVGGEVCLYCDNDDEKHEDHCPIKRHRAALDGLPKVVAPPSAN